MTTLKNVPEIRYDLTNGIENLDWESVEGLINLTDCWSARARLRQRWMDRNDPVLGSDIGKEEADGWACLTPAA